MDSKGTGSLGLQGVQQIDLLLPSLGRAATSTCQAQAVGDIEGNTRVQRHA